MILTFSRISTPDDALTDTLADALEGVSACDDRQVAARALRELLRAAGYEIVRTAPAVEAPPPDPLSDAWLSAR